MQHRVPGRPRLTGGLDPGRERGGRQGACANLEARCPPFLLVAVGGHSGRSWPWGRAGGLGGHVADWGAWGNGVGEAKWGRNEDSPSGSSHFLCAELAWWRRRESVCLQCGRPGFDLQVGKILWKRERLPTPVLLLWKIPWMEEPGRMVQSMGPQRVGHD